MQKPEFIAHKSQSVQAHLANVSAYTETFAGKIGLGYAGAVIGYFHDLGKYSKEFQEYIKSAIGQINPDEDAYVDAKGKKGRIDHSTAGAQYIWDRLKNKEDVEWQLARQIMALCIASHHSGLINCLSPFGENVFSVRMQKPDNNTHCKEVSDRVDVDVPEKIIALLNSDATGIEFRQRLAIMNTLSPMIGSFHLGLLARFIFSALIDADRIDSANITDNAVNKLRDSIHYSDWDILIDKLERHLAGFVIHNHVDEIRRNVSNHCLNFATRGQGIYLLTVPTGGGKTLASLRFALHHAKLHNMERIIYVIPYTSIIDQNASVTRNILEDEDTAGTVVLEHHSNLTPEIDTWHGKILSENWDSPIVYTTAVQFLETLFASGTRGARRMHQLANAIIVFDEIQTIPIRTIHLFNNAINFLVSQCGATAVFCTATQPILDKVDKDKGAATLSYNPEMMPNIATIFNDLRRVDVTDARKNGGWGDGEIVAQVVEEAKACGSVLVIVNTKAAAQRIYTKCKKGFDAGSATEVYHLSTSMCPAHRMDVLNKVKTCLNPASTKPVICVSTQLIEAGVDIDFSCVIRYLAGLDSIAQAAGRCNRNGLREKPGKVLVINPADENLDKLRDIRIAKEKTERVLDEFKKSPATFDGDLIGPKAITLYYKYYYFDRADEMVYPVNAGKIGHDDNLLSLLSSNYLSVKAFNQANKKAPTIVLRQSFKSAAEAFEAIDAPTEGVIVPYGETGAQLIANLCGAFDVKKQHDLLRRAQRYSVNVFPNILKTLVDGQCIHEVQEGSGIMYLDDQYYSSEFGLSTEPVSPMKFQFA